MLEADYIIVGAGSAGCALAYRLSEDGRHSVLVLEYGGTDFGPLIQMPAAFSIPMNMRTYDWGYRTEPEPHLGGRRLATPRGKVIGGSSSINGMVFVRGHAEDFDRWEEAGARGWAFKDVLPYFQRMETRTARRGEEGWRGSSTARCTSRAARSTNPLYRAFTEAGVEAGYGFTADYNGSRQEGFGPMEMTVWKGRRWSAANAYLRPALKRPNVQLRTGVLAEKILFEGRRAVGVSDPALGPHGDGARAQGGDRLRLRHQLAEASDAVRHRAGGGAARARHRGASPTGPASAATCRTTSRSTSSRPAPRRSR